MLYNRTLLFNHLIYTSLHLLIPNSQSFPLPPSSPLAATSLFSTSVGFSHTSSSSVLAEHFVLLTTAYLILLFLSHHSSCFPAPFSPPPPPPIYEDHLHAHGAHIFFTGCDLSFFRHPVSSVHPQACHQLNNSRTDSIIFSSKGPPLTF